MAKPISISVLLLGFLLATAAARPSKPEAARVSSVVWGIRLRDSDPLAPLEPEIGAIAPGDTGRRDLLGRTWSIKTKGSNFGLDSPVEVGGREMLAARSVKGLRRSKRTVLIQMQAAGGTSYVLPSSVLANFRARGSTQSCCVLRVEPTVQLPLLTLMKWAEIEDSCAGCAHVDSYALWRLDLQPGSCWQEVSYYDVGG